MGQAAGAENIGIGMEGKRTENSATTNGAGAKKLAVGGVRLHRNYQLTPVSQKLQDPPNDDFGNRTLGMAVIGQPGMGKTSLLQELILQDFRNGTSNIIFDAHGDLTQDVLASLPQHHNANIMVLAVDPDYPFGLNLYQSGKNTSLENDRTVDRVVQIFKKLTASELAYYPRMEAVLRNTARTILNTGFTMAEIPYLFYNEAFRNELLKDITNPAVQLFWQEYEARRSFERLALIESTMNKFDQFLSSEAIRLIVSQPQTTIPFADLISQSGITLFVYLPIGILGEGVTEFLGMLLLSQLSSAIYARVASVRPRLHLYIDEFQRFATSGGTTSRLLREGRKFNVGTTVAFQSLLSLDEENRASVLNAGTLAIFQVQGGYDAEILSKQFKLKREAAEQVPKMRMEQNYKEWDAEEWTNETARLRFEDYESRRIEYWESINHAKQTLRQLSASNPQAQALEKGIEKAERVWDKAMELPYFYRKTVHHKEPDGMIPVKRKEEVETYLTVRGRRGYIQTVKGGSKVEVDKEQLYDMEDGNPRLFSDMRTELEMELATLPQFTYCCQYLNAEGDVEEKQLTTNLPPPRQPNAQATIMRVLQQSRERFGTPARIVEEQAAARIAPFLIRPEEPKESRAIEAQNEPPNEQKGSRRKREIKPET